MNICSNLIYAFFIYLFFVTLEQDERSLIRVGKEKEGREFFIPVDVLHWYQSAETFFFSFVT